MTTIATTDITLDGKDLDITVADTDVAIEEGVEQSSTVTITIRDKTRRLLTSGLLDHDGDGRLDRTTSVTVDGAQYRLHSVSKAGDSFTLEAESEVVARFRDKHGPLKPKAGTTDVQLVRLLAARIGVDVTAPTKEPIAAPRSRLKSKAERAKADQTRERGISDSADVTVGGKQMRAEQRRNADSALSTAYSLGDHPKAILALVEACIVEPGDTLEDGFTNPSKPGDHGSTGLLQLLPSTAKALGVSATDIPAVVKAFMQRGFTGKGGAIALAKAHPDWKAGQIAQAVEGSAHPDRYDTVAGEARKIIGAYTGSDGGSSGGQQTSGGIGPGSSGGGSLIAVGPGENYWQCITRLAGEWGKRAFVVGERLYYISEQNLIASRPVVAFTETHDGVDWIDWEWAPNKQVNQATVSCRVSEFKPDPGAVADLAVCGPADGRWLVSSVQWSPYTITATIELRRGTELLRRAAPSNGASAASHTAKPGNETGSGSAGGSWKYAAGIPNTLNSKMRPFMDRMVSFYDGTIIVTTTTNHSYLTSSGHVSDHNDGGAADIGSVANGFKIGDPNGGGTRIAIAAFRACGMSYGTARTRALARSFERVPCPEGSAQILWLVADHADHVHVGVH